MIAKDMSESKVIVRTTAHDRFTIEGNVSPGFEAVREAFAENFVRRAGVGYAYVTSQMGTQLTGNPRDVALREALYSAIPGPAGDVRRRVA